MNRLTRLIENAEEKRLKKALTGFLNGSYRVSDLRREDDEVVARVSNGDEKDYGVAINDSQVFCHCPDYFFTNEGICKHILMLSFALLSGARQRSAPVEN